MAQRPAAIPTFGPLPNPTAASEPGSLAGPGIPCVDPAPAWVHRIELQHARWMPIVTLAVATLSIAGYVPRSVELVLLVACVAALGLPHGALDYLSGRRVFEPRFRFWWFAPFGLVYLGLSATVVLGWLLAPVASLLAFFFISAAHFGHDDVRPTLALGADSRFARAGRVAEATARGGFVIVALLFMHPTEVSQLFAHLLPASLESIEANVLRVGPRLAVLNGALLAVVLAHHLGGWAAGSDAHGRLALEIVALTALFCLAPPLIAFIVYFCLWHSFRHSVRLAADLNPAGPRNATRAFLRHAWPTTAGAVLLGVGGYVWMASEATETAIVKVVFIGLSALTVPHVVFCALAERSKARSLGVS